MTFKLRPKLIEEARSQIEELRKALDEVRRKRNELAREEAEIATMLQGLTLVAGAKTDTDQAPLFGNKEKLFHSGDNGHRPALWRDAVEILKTTNRPMTMTELLSALEKKGRAISSPNKREILRQALLKAAKTNRKIEKNKNGTALYYLYRNEG